MDLAKILKKNNELIKEMGKISEILTDGCFGGLLYYKTAKLFQKKRKKYFSRRYANLWTWQIYKIEPEITLAVE